MGIKQINNHLSNNRDNWRADLSNAVAALESIRETILPKIITGRILTVEGSDNEVLILLDEFSGIDYIKHDSEGLQGIAARVQFGSNYESFTIRYKRASGVVTEYEKRLKQIREGYFYPTLTMQAYFDNVNDKNLLSVSIMRTDDLFAEIERNPKARTFTNAKDGNIFKALFWRDIPKDLIKIYRA